MAGSFKPPKQWVLSEHETITSFASWQSNILYHLSLNNEFAQFLDDDVTWQKKSVANRGLAADGDPVPAAERKTGAQKNIVLERMLGLIAQFSPSLLRNDIIGKSLSLDWIWKRIRKHYSLQQSEVNFLRLASIKREPDERYETLYQRIIAHLEDNLLTTQSGIEHDGAAITANEELTPTCERIAVYLWLTLIDQRLPAYVARVYSHDLQKKSLKDLQPQICDSMDSLLAEINNQEDIQINYSRSSFNNRQPRFNNKSTPLGNSVASKFNRSRPPQNQGASTSQKDCILCKSAGRPSRGHNVSSCWYLSKADKLEMVKALQVIVEYDGDECEGEDDEENYALRCTASIDTTTAPQPDAPAVTVETSSVVRRVKNTVSPHFFAFYLHHTIKILVDTGATSTLVSLSFVKRANITVRPTLHSARQLDKSNVPVSGEVKFYVSYGKRRLLVDGLVNDSLDCDILAGCPFCVDNYVDVSCAREEIIMGDPNESVPTIIKYGSRPNSIQHDIYRVESTVLRTDSSKVILPGEYLEIDTPDLHSYEGEISIEPRADSPLHGEWPDCNITRVIQGTVRIPNHTNEPISLKRAMHIGQIRRVTTPIVSSDQHLPHIPSKKPPASKPYSSTTSIDPSAKLLTESERSRFAELHRDYDERFSPNISVYNGYSGNVTAYIDMGPMPPPHTKPQIPLYNQSNMRLLQDVADEIESIGVLAKPEELGVKVRHASPSFLVKKPDDTHRMVTAFNQLSQYVRYPPSVSITCDDVLRRLACWKLIVKTDMKKAYYQIPMAKSSLQWLGTYTPFGGLRVYTRPVMGMPGSAEFLAELLSRVFGEYTRQGFVVFIADDMYVGGNTVDELFTNWETVLHCCQLNNLTLSPTKTIVCPHTTTILGWTWCAGTITISAHKISPLVTIEAPKTCTSMRSFIGSYKAVSRCIPRYSSFMAPLENSIKGLQGSQLITWTDDLHEHFKRAQNAIKSPAVLTIPKPTDKLILTVDASPLNDGIGATLFSIRDGDRHVSEFFSVKLKAHQKGWQPCELEALAITAAVKHFEPYIRESTHQLQVLSDSKPCVQAFGKLCKGKFSASSRVSTFLSCLSEHNLTIQHLKGDGNRSSDFSSRNPAACCDPSCQVCEFVKETAESVVRAVSVDEVLSGSATIPYYNKAAWKSAQQGCPSLRKAHTYLMNGTRPSRKVKNVIDVRRYLEVCSITSSGLLVVRKSDPYMHRRELIVVPSNVLHGLLTALHLYFNHATVLQLTKIFNRYFFALNVQQVIKSVVDSCHQCTALKSVPKEVFVQSASPSPEAPGKLFASDVIRRNQQKIFCIRDVHSSFTIASLIPDETANALQSALITTTASLRAPRCSVRVDTAPGFQSLKNDPQLNAHGIGLDFGRVKNANKNPVAEKCNQELEIELLRIDPSGAPVSAVTLQDAVHMLNSRIRNRGLSAREILFCRDQVTSMPLNINDDILRRSQEKTRDENHQPSAISKSRDNIPATPANVNVGSLVYIKKEGDKSKARESYMVMGVKGHLGILQKLNASGNFMSKTYEVPLVELFPATKSQCVTSDSSSSDEEEMQVPDNLAVDPAPVADNAPVADVHVPSRYPARHRQEPSWLREDVWERP